jgi:hypothetical protein
MSKEKAMAATAWTRRWRDARGALLAGALTFFVAGSVMAANLNTDMAKNVGERSPLFSAVTSQDALIDYNRDFYGRHHLVLTFFPAAFTPV